MAIEAKEARQAVISQMMRTIDVFDAEIYCEMRDWDGLTHLVEVSPRLCLQQHADNRRICKSEATSRPLGATRNNTPWRPLPTCCQAALTVLRAVSGSFEECLTDLVTSNLQHPRGDDRLYQCSAEFLYQAILGSHSINDPPEIIRFARWMRTILLIAFHHAGTDKDAKAMHFVTQARDVLRTPAGKQVRGTCPCCHSYRVVVP